MAIEPVTREERFLAAAGGRSVTPPTPITRKEQLLQGIIDAVKSGGATPDVIENAVNDYLNANPVKPGATTEQAAQIEQNKTDIADLQAEVDELKESGGNGSGENVNFRDPAEGEIFVLGAGTGGDSGGGEIPPDVTTYTVLNVLTGVSTSNPVAVVAENAVYVATITADEGYTLKSIVVKMGGVDISATAVSGNTISIPVVTGNVVITATATEALPIPTDGLVVFYDMSRENVNNTIVDETGNGYDIQFRKNSDKGVYENGYITYNGDGLNQNAFTAPVSGDTCTMIFTISNHNVNNSTIEPYAGLGGSYSMGDYINKLRIFKGSVQGNVGGTATINSADGVKQVMAGSFDVADTTTVKLYIDGVLDSTNEGLSSYAYTSVSLLTGDKSSAHWLTRMHNFALYNRVLTDSEVAEISEILLNKAGGNV